MKLKRQYDSGTREMKIFKLTNITGSVISLTIYLLILFSIDNFWGGIAFFVFYVWWVWFWSFRLSHKVAERMTYEGRRLKEVERHMDSLAWADGIEKNDDPRILKEYEALKKEREGLIKFLR